MTDVPAPHPIDADALRAMLEELNQKRREAASETEWERHYGDGYKYQYGSERTYWDLAQAVQQVSEDIQNEMESNNDDVLTLLPDETMEHAEQRIQATIDARAVLDERALILDNLWGHQLIMEALERCLRYQRKMGDILQSQGVQGYTSLTIHEMYKEQCGLSEPLPGREDA